MTNREDLRKEFTKEHIIKWENSQGEPDIEYVQWLENKLLSQPSLESILELMGKVEEDGISIRLHSDGSGAIFRYPKELDVIANFRDLQELQSHLNKMLKE